MADDRRHHKASRDVQIVLVPVPCEAGSPEPLKWAKPAKYPFTRRAPWQPARAIPSKASASKRLLDSIIENEEAVKSLLRPLPPSAMLAR
jgi:hypothetical protein